MLHWSVLLATATRKLRTSQPLQSTLLTSSCQWSWKPCWGPLILQLSHSYLHHNTSSCDNNKHVLTGKLAVQVSTENYIWQTTTCLDKFDHHQRHVFFKWAKRCWHQAHSLASHFMLQNMCCRCKLLFWQQGNMLSWQSGFYNFWLAECSFSDTKNRLPTKT